MRRAVSVLVVGSVSLLARPCSPNREVSVSALVEEGDRVLAPAHRAGDEELGPPERFLVAEVHDGQNTGLHGYAPSPRYTWRCTPARRRTRHRTPMTSGRGRAARDDRDAMDRAAVGLRPPPTHSDLAAITPWFEGPDTRRFVGGPRLAIDVQSR